MKLSRLALLALLALLLAPFNSLYAQTPTVDVARTGIDKEVIYFVMPDRYRNGDSSNDNFPGFDPTHTAFFHGGDLKGLTGNCVDDDGLARLKKLGFTAIWLTPLVVQQPPTDGGAGYHGYWGVDFLDVDPHLGTKEDLLALSSCAEKLGLKLILDVVTNHTGDIVWYNNREAYIPDKYKNIKNPSWLNEISNYHNYGDMNSCWSPGACVRDGDFFGLDDLATEKPEVYNGLAEVYGDWIEKYGFVGFRVDTARHLDNEFFKNWSPQINQIAGESGMANFTIFGEVWEPSPIALMPYIRVNKMQSALDFPFQRVAVDYAASSSNAGILKNLFAYDDYYTSATSSASNLVTFLGNHDMGRANFLIERVKINPPGQLLSRVKLANTLLYLSRGIPTVYYGDEVGILGSGNGRDQLARQDLFPTKVEIWKQEARVTGRPVGDADSFTDTFSNPIAKHLMALSELRRAHPALANEQMQIRYAKGPVFAFSKRALNEKREYLVALNNGAKARTVTISTATSGKWRDLIDGKSFMSKSGELTLKLDGLSSRILRAESDINLRGIKLGKLTLKEDFLSGFYNLSLKVESKDLAIAEFFIRTKGVSKWSTLGVDLNQPFKVFIDPYQYSGPVEVKAIVVDSKGGKYELQELAFNIATP
ncbi:MAG: alpha-amylase family glycosyl hydrolase [Candidatus Nanopelagicales bacterium]|jgi:glycosidase|nr:alpha-amylase family glycosyl hydrolase [Candidatus Nanopelagicales bacterium]